MGRKKEITKDGRILKEEKRLKKIYRNIDKEKMNAVEGLIQRAAYMRIQLEDYERDINDNGYIEMFTQSERTDPYERERPVARLYNSTGKNYQTLIKQLTDLLPKDEPKKTDDGFEDFVSGRD